MPLKDPIARKEYDRQYRLKNLEKRRLQNKIVKDSKILRYYVIYCLPNVLNDDRAYVGMTKNPTDRMQTHKKVGRNTDGWFLLDIAETKTEAKKIEKQYHSQGYVGSYGWQRKTSTNIKIK